MLHVKIAFTGRSFEARAVQDGDGATDVLDQSTALQNPSGQTNARTARAQHLRQEFVSDKSMSESIRS